MASGPWPDKVVRALAVAVSILLAAPSFAIDNKYHGALSVYENHGECTFDDRTVLCDEIPRLLRELAIRVDQKIVVSAQGTGQDAHDRAMSVVALLEAAGYQDVSVAGFLRQPEVGDP